MPFLGKWHQTYCSAHWIRAVIYTCNRDRRRSLQGHFWGNGPDCTTPVAKCRGFGHFSNRGRRRPLQLATGMANIQVQSMSQGIFLGHLSNRGPRGPLQSGSGDPDNK